MAEVTGEHSIRFDLAGANDRELPLILGLMPILARHATSAENFQQTSFAPIVGSVPYVIAGVDPGKSVTLKRSRGYWGQDLAVNRGLWNFDEIRFDYYRDANSYHEAFKRGLFDMRPESDPGRWQTAYDFPALRDGRVVKETFPYGLPKGMEGLCFNTRRPMFADIRVREALLHLFDFEWINHTYFFDLYKRTASYFDGCELSAHGVAANARERELLAALANGWTNLQIAARTGISRNTVKYHLKNLYDKLGVSNRAMAVALHVSVNRNDQH